MDTKRVRRLWHHEESDTYIQTLTNEEVDDDLARHCVEVTREHDHEIAFLDQLNKDGNPIMALSFGKNKPSAGKPGAKKGGFVYQPRSDEQTRAAATKRVSGGEQVTLPNIKTFQCTEGDHDIRILPPTWDDADHFAMDVFVHYGIGGGDSFLCMRKMKDEDCAVCDARKEAQSAGEDEMAKAMNPTARAAFYLIDRQHEKEGPQLWLSPYQNFHQEMLLQARDPKTKSFVQLDNPDEGFDVSFTAKGQQINRKYSGIKVARSESPLSDDADTAQEWLQYVVDNPIPDVLVYPEYEDVQKALEGGVRTRDEAGKEETTSKPRPGGKPTAAGKPGGKPGKPKVEEPEPEEEAATEFDPRDWDWETVHALDEEETNELIAAAEIDEADFADIKSLEEAQDIICDRIGAKPPKPAKEEKKGGGGGLASRLAALRKDRK